MERSIVKAVALLWNIPQGKLAEGSLNCLDIFLNGHVRKMEDLLNHTRITLALILLFQYFQMKINLICLLKSH